MRKKIFTLSVLLWTIAAFADNVPPEQYWYEAESTTCAVINLNYYVIPDDSAASNGKYAVQKEGLNSLDSLPGGEINIPFKVNNDGDFHIWFRVNCVNPGSLWIMLDGAPAVIFDGIDTKGEWNWINVANPALPAGKHYLTIMYRSGQVKTDKIYITNDPNNQAPVGTGDKETPCSSAFACSIIDFESGNLDDWTIQNPGGGVVITQEYVNSGKYALKMVSPSNGSATDPSAVQAISPPFDIVSGHAYNVYFSARTTGGEGKGRISITGDGQLGDSQYLPDFNVTDSMQNIQFLSLAASGSSVRLSFDMGYVADKTYYIDDIVLEDISTDRQPVLEIDSTVWNAGNVNINDSLQSGKFSIRNIGTDTLRITATTELPTPWSVTPELNGVTLRAGQVQKFTFTYAPTIKEASDVDFTVTTNAGNAVIELRGSGIITNIPPVENPDIKIFSRAQGKINITAPENSKVKVSDILGRMKIYIMPDSMTEIPVLPGIYIVRVESGNSVNTRKVIVK